MIALVLLLAVADPDPALTLPYASTSGAFLVNKHGVRLGHGGGFSPTVFGLNVELRYFRRIHDLAELSFGGEVIVLGWSNRFTPLIVGARIPLYRSERGAITFGSEVALGALEPSRNLIFLGNVSVAFSRRVSKRVALDSAIFASTDAALPPFKQHGQSGALGWLGARLGLSAGGNKGGFFLAGEIGVGMQLKTAPFSDRRPLFRFQLVCGPQWRF